MAGLSRQRLEKLLLFDCLGDHVDVDSAAWIRANSKAAIAKTLQLHIVTPPLLLCAALRHRLYRCPPRATWRRRLCGAGGHQPSVVFPALRAASRWYWTAASRVAKYATRSTASSASSQAAQRSSGSWVTNQSTSPSVTTDSDACISTSQLENPRACAN